MALFLPRGHQRPNAILGRIGGHPQARNLVHWFPGLGSDPFTAAGGSPFVGAYYGVTDVIGATIPKEAFGLEKATTSTLPGTVFYTADTAYHQSAIVFVADQAKFTGVAAGGAGATLSVWVKLKLAVPVDSAYTGFALVQKNGIANTHYTYVDGTAYMATWRHDRVSFTPRADVDRTQWHHVAITHTGVEWKCYQNAQLAYADATGDGNVYLPNTGGGAAYTALQGSWSDGSYIINGYSCDWRLYNRALSQAEIQALYAPHTRWSLYYGV